MKMGVVFLFLLVGVFCHEGHDHDHHDGDGEEHVHTLDSSNFDSFLANKPLALLEFYAPWCDHCKRLAPQYEQAAATLYGEVPLAKVDCTTEKDLCTKYGVQGFPTLKYFRNDGSAPTDYQSGRTASDIVKAVRKQNAPAFSIVDEEALDKLRSEENVVVVGFFSNAEAEEAKGFKEVANTLRNKLGFAIVVNKDLAAKEKATFPSVVVFKKFDEPQVKHTGELTVEAIQKFAQEESFPVFGEIGPENYQEYVERGFPIVWAFLEYDDSERLQALEPIIAQVAKSFRGLSFVKLDGVKWASHAKNFGLSGKLPGIVIEDRASRKKYVFGSAEVSVGTLTAHAKGFVDGTLAPTLKSEEPPTENDGPVKVVVGKTFDDIVLDSSKDVLVEFYAPWCGHCKSLAPKYEELGQEFASIPSIVIAKVDATENDTPAEIQGFPTLLLYRATDKQNPLTFNGERAVRAMSDWIREHADTLKKTEKPHLHEDL